ncbi:hypothetical protein ScPMuIL_014509 [Solemya velum]
MNAEQCWITVGVVAFRLQLIVHYASAGMRFASELDTTESCQNEICSELYKTNVTGFLLGAPCPPPNNFSLLCEHGINDLGTTNFLTCEEKTVIIRKCLKLLPQDVKCDILEQCQHLKCLPSSSLLTDCDAIISNSPIGDKVVVIINDNSTQNITLGHSKMATVTDSTVKYYENVGEHPDDLPMSPQPLREEKDSLVGLAALLLLLIPLIFIIWFCCKRKKSRKEDKYPKQEDASSTAGLCKTVSSVNESTPPEQTNDFENLDLPYIDSDELVSVRTETPPHLENTVT